MSTTYDFSLQASAQAEAFMSLAAFCMTDPETLFAVPSDSTLDLKGWVADFCSLNFTAVEEELMSYQTAMAIEKIVSPISLKLLIDVVS